jgi:hypothetical protein
MTKQAREESAARPDNVRCGVVRHLAVIGERDELRDHPDHSEVAALMARRGWTESQALYWLNTTLCDGSPAQGVIRWRR